MQRKGTVLTLYSVGHALVDAASIAAVMGLSQDKDKALIYVLLYNFLAFATQPLLGLFADRLRKPERFSICGLLLTACGLAFFSFPVCSITLVGIGNALFHVGGGIISLSIDPGKAWAPGVFIAPGNLGVLLGLLTYKDVQVHWLYISLLILVAFLCFFIKRSAEENLSTGTNLEKPNRWVLNAALMLILVTVVIRSYAGLAIQYPWKKDQTLFIILSVCVTLGKALGGILSDKFGVIRVPAIGLLLAIPCIVIGFEQPVYGAAGMLLFNLTMPVTLILAFRLLPEYKGFSFGLTVLALSMGSIPAYSGAGLTEAFSITALLVTSVITLMGGYLLSIKVVNKKLEALE